MTTPSDPAYTPPPAYSSAPVPPPASGQSTDYPGKVLGIVALIVSFFVSLVGLILGIIALVQSRRAGRKNGFALAAVIISSVLLIISIIVTIVLITLAVTFGQEALAACAEAGYTGSVTVRDVVVECSTITTP